MSFNFDEHPMDELREVYEHLAESNAEEYFEVLPKLEHNCKLLDNVDPKWRGEIIRLLKKLAPVSDDEDPDGSAKRFTENLLEIDRIRKEHQLTSMTPHQSFNGGKMLHIFKFNDWNKYIPEFESKEAEQALQHGKFYIKVDGSNACLFKEDDKWMIYSRYDDKKNKYGSDKHELPPDFRRLPVGRNTDHYLSDTHKHSYFYVLRPRPDIVKTKLDKINQQLYQIVDKHQEYLDSLGKEFITVELVGHKFSNTPGVNVDCDIALHQDQNIECNEGRGFTTYEQLKQVLSQGIDWFTTPPNFDNVNTEYVFEVSTNCEPLWIYHRHVDKLVICNSHICDPKYQHLKQMFSVHDWNSDGYYVSENGHTRLRIGVFTPPPMFVEGFVIEYQGLYWKVRSDSFEGNNLYSSLKNKKVPVPSTLVKPRLLSELEG